MDCAPERSYFRILKRCKVQQSDCSEERVFFFLNIIISANLLSTNVSERLENGRCFFVEPMQKKESSIV